ncbi:MAG: FHA domain-containing protein [Myxococcales bacterium]|nr:FHA domain-containing protein [Myxococcales bacterium]
MSSPSGYVLKFISGKYQGGEFPLEYEREIIIGRGSDLDMVLVEDMVSRRHAKITTHNSEFYIEDLGSTNGTFVNGEKISRAKLRDGDRILVGTSIIKLVSTDGEIDITEEVTDLPEDAYNPPNSTRSVPAATSTGAMSGRIEEVPLPDLLQLFSSSRKTGVLIVVSNIEGRIYLQEGRAVYATLDDEPEMSPEKAFYRILWMRHGTFVLEADDGRELPGEPLQVSTEALMMEAMRQQDEIENLGSDVPGMQAALEVARPLVPPLRSLSPELLDTLQLVINHNTVMETLNKSLAPDLDTMQDIIYLLRNGYLTELETLD